MGTCQCDGNEIKRTEAVVSLKGNSQDPNIPDLAPAPTYFIGKPKQRKKITSNYNTLGIMPTVDRALVPGNPIEMQYYDKIRSKNRRKRLKKANTAKVILEHLTKITGKVQTEDDLEMISAYLSQHFAFGAMSSEEMY